MAAKLVLLLCVLVVILESQRTEGFGLSLGLLQGIGKWRTVLSLSQSLMNRVANVRASRGDLEGAERARKIADKMGGGGLGLGFWSVGWDYARSYAWRDAASSDEILGAVSDSNEVLNALKELNSMKLEREKARWVYENYQRVLGPSRSLLRRLLLVFTRSGPLREIVLILQKEAEGDLLRDCLDVGANDLKGLLNIAKDIALNLLSSPSGRSHPSNEL